MKRMLGVLLLMALPVWAADMPPGCAWLCGNWVLDIPHSEAVEPVINAALEKFKEPEPRKPKGPRRNDPPAVTSPGGAAPGPVYDRPTGTQMRDLLLAVLAAPATLVLSEQGDEVLIRGAEGPERHYFPGESHTRVDAQGTAKIRADWKKDSLAVGESYGSKHAQTETYTLLPDGTLEVIRVVERPDVKAMRLRSVYRRR